MKNLVLIFGLIISSTLFSSCVVKAQPVNTRTVVVKKAPINHKIVIKKGKRYYTWGGRHYKKTKRGFIVVRI